MRAVVFVAGFALLGVAAAASPASADITHVVQPGHTLEAIARRYHVSEQSIVDANHIKDGGRLKPGQTLIIPGVVAPGTTDSKGEKVGPTRNHRRSDRAASASNDVPEPRRLGGHGIVEVVRSGEDAHVRVRDSHGRIPAAALGAFEHLMRQGSTTHPPDSRLLALIGVVSDHFGGKPIEVVSGYRAYSPTQYTPHSNHNSGRALDFRIDGTDNSSVYEFCLTLRNAGCGFYPNSSFVHLDARESKSHWIDRSRPGEAPVYDRPGTAADESRGDVPDESDVSPEAPLIPLLPKDDATRGSPTPQWRIPPFDSETSL
jgi:uncharacterized protein YcbK (DUF882 family)